MPLFDKKGFTQAVADTYLLKELSTGFESNIPLFVRTFPYRSRTAFNLPYGFVRGTQEWGEKFKVTPWKDIKTFSEKTRLNVILSSVGDLGLDGGQVTAFHSELLLGSDADSVRTQYSKNFRKYLANQRNRGHKTGVVVDFESSASSLREFHHLLASQYVRQHKMLFHSEGLYSRLMAGGFARLLTARRSGMLIGALFILQDDFKVYYSWGARSSNDPVAVHTLLIEALIQDSISRGMRSLDFGLTAVSDPDLLSYKQKWGTRTSNVYSYSTSKNRVHRDVNTSLPFLRSLFGMVPVSAAKVISPVLVRALIQ